MIFGMANYGPDRFTFEQLEALKTRLETQAREVQMALRARESDTSEGALKCLERDARAYLDRGPLPQWTNEKQLATHLLLLIDEVRRLRRK